MLFRSTRLRGARIFLGAIAFWRGSVDTRLAWLVDAQKRSRACRDLFELHGPGLVRFIGRLGRVDAVALDRYLECLRSTPEFRSEQQRRLEFALSYFQPALRSLLVCLVSSREDSNFTYDLTDLNKKHLAGFLAAIIGESIPRIFSYIAELENDDALRAHVRSRVAQSHPSDRCDYVARYGRRLGWYVLARTTKPRVVVETGVDKGLGTCVLAAALMRNAEEGAPGRIYGTDINPRAGILFAEPYAKLGTILYGDSIESLGKLTDTIVLFINDSDHSSEYEWREYQRVKPRLADDAIIVGDNAHVSDSLYRFAIETSRRFLFFREIPSEHWYPGAGIGVAFQPVPSFRN